MQNARRGQSDGPGFRLEGETCVSMDASRVGDYAVVGTDVMWNQGRSLLRMFAIIDMTILVTAPTDPSQDYDTPGEVPRPRRSTVVVPDGAEYGVVSSIVAQAGQRPRDGGRCGGHDRRAVDQVRRPGTGDVASPRSTRSSRVRSTLPRPPVASTKRRVMSSTSTGTASRITTSAWKSVASGTVLRLGAPPGPPRCRRRRG